MLGNIPRMHYGFARITKRIILAQRRVPGSMDLSLSSKKIGKRPKKFATAAEQKTSDYHVGGAGEVANK